MRVSVFIPTYNRVGYLEEAIESVLAQTYGDLEVVVVDDGSDDGTEELVRSYNETDRPGRVRYVGQPHLGIAAARNRAVREASGELIAWCDSDDLWEPTKLERQVAYLDAHPSCAIVFCLVRSFTAIPEEDLGERQRAVMALHARGYRYYMASACVRREVFERCGTFDEGRAYAEDDEWVARVCAAGVAIDHCIDEPLYLRRVHDGQVTYQHGRIDGRGSLAIWADAIRRARAGKAAP